MIKITKVSAGDKKVLKNVITKFGRILSTDMSKIEEPMLRNLLTGMFTQTKNLVASFLVDAPKESEKEIEQNEENGV